MIAVAHTLYVLDFDGVVCDGLDECLLTAWIAFHALPERDWSMNLLDIIPESFKRRFRNHRNFVRHDGHFLLPFMKSEPISSSEEFGSLYDAVPEIERENFRDRFRMVRERIRNSDYANWIGMHQLHGPVLAALRNMKEFYIVSGKDAESISAILVASGISLPPDHIFGSQSNKATALLNIKQRAEANQQRIIFCDDNLANALDARAAGIDTLWARWGYHTKADIAEAEHAGLRGIALGDVEAAFTP